MASRADPWVLALDIGTSRVKCGIFDALAQPVAGMHTQRPLRMKSPEAGAAEIDPRHMLRACTDCVDEVLAKADAQVSRIAAVGVCSFWHSMLGINSRGSAVTPIYTWAETRAWPQAEWLRSHCNEEAAHARTGCRFHPSYWPARLLWLRATRSEQFGRTSMWLSPADWLLRRWLGTSGCSVSMASATGIFHQQRCDWDEELLNILGVSKLQLPAITDVDAPLGRLAPLWAKRWPALADAEWIPAIGDGAASNVGSACEGEDRAALNIGTSSALRVVTQQPPPRIPGDLWCYRLDRAHSILGAAFSDGGQDLEWARRVLRLTAQDRAAIGDCAPTRDAPLFAPFLAGERSFRWRANAKGAIVGLSITTGAREILRAIREGLALRVAAASHILRAQFPHLNLVVASGGGLASVPGFAQLLADGTGISVLAADHLEATSRGAAVTALRALGIWTGAEPAPLPEGERFEPHWDHYADYQERLAQQEDLIRRCT